MVNVMERPENKEKIETSKVELKIFRHGEKEKDKSKTDEEILLTEGGRIQAAGKSDNDLIEQSVAFGSPRKRAQETAGLVMAGSSAEITGTESLDELNAKLNEAVGHGKKIGIDERLNFNIDEKSPFGEKALAAFMNGKFLKFLVEESDQVAKEVGDENGDTYNRMASHIAELIKKYITVAPRFDELVQNKSKGYEDTLKRFLGTHQGVSESFLAKVIEKTKGVGERDKFVSVLNNQGFDFVEGFTVDIVTLDGKEQQVKISYKKEKEVEKDGQKTKEVVFQYDEIVPTEVIDSIIEQK